jgi:NACHT domain
MIGQSGLIVAVLAVVAFVVFKPQSDRFCDHHKVGCSLTTGFLSTGVVVLAGYFVLFVWTIRKAQSYYVKLARETPDRLMDSPPRVRANDVVGREQLTRTLARESAFATNGAPIVVVGEAGSGKTTFLLKLTQHLAETGSVPVDVSLRAASLPLSIRRLAQDEFVRRIDPVVRAETDATRIWRKLCAQGAIVVLADGLDEVAVELPRRERDHVIRAALVSARNERVAVVVTTRPETVPFAAPASQFELAPLDEDEALEYLAKRVSIETSEDRERLREVVSAGQITHSPLYLNVIAALHRLKELPHDVSQPKELLLVELLDSWVILLEKGKLRPEVEFESGQRKRIIEGLSAVGYTMTLASSAETKLSRLDDELKELRASRSGRDMETGLMIEGASQLELIDALVLEKDIGVRFNHAITQAYFTSRYLRLQAETDARDRLLEAAGTEALEAVLMWASRSPKTAAATAKALLTRAEQLDADSALIFRVGAHGLATIGGSDDLAKRTADAIDGSWTRSTPRSRLAAVRRLDGRSDERSYRILHMATRDPSYRVRWVAAQEIIAGGGEAYLALEKEFAETLASAEAAQWSEWTEEATHDISVLAWMLPAIRGAADESVAATIDAQLKALTELVPDGMPPGTEASLAQGFKMCALMYPAAGTSAGARALLDRCGFWYSRIQLLHALCVSGIHNDAERRAAREQMQQAASNDHEHSFVREAARLSTKALKERDWRRYVWEDESSLIAQSASMVAAETAVLVADVALMLNLTEQGITKSEVEERKQRTYGRNELPYCLGTSRDRSEQLFHGCDERCDFDLCPYPRSAELVQARGEFSQAFCEHQIDLLARRRGVRIPTKSKRPASWSRTSRAARRRFWEMMESRAL